MSMDGFTVSRSNTIMLSVKDIEAIFNTKVLADSIEFETRILPVLSAETTSASSSWELTVMHDITSQRWYLEKSNKPKRKPIKEVFLERSIGDRKSFIGLCIYVKDIQEHIYDMYVYGEDLKIEIYLNYELYNKLKQMAPHLIIKELL